MQFYDSRYIGLKVNLSKPKKKVKQKGRNEKEV